jgi:hypothetical protein
MRLVYLISLLLGWKRKSKKGTNKSCLYIYFFVETGSFDAFHQSIHIVDHFQHPALIVALLYRVITDL